MNKKKSYRCIFDMYSCSFVYFFIIKFNRLFSQCKLLSKKGRGIWQKFEGIIQKTFLTGRSNIKIHPILVKDLFLMVMVLKNQKVN